MLAKLGQGNLCKSVHVSLSIALLLTQISIQSQLVNARSSRQTTKSNTKNNLFKYDDRWALGLHMPDIRADHDDQYLCMAYRANSGKFNYEKQSKWIVGFKPEANSSLVHHMILYSCDLPGIYQPGSPKFVWDCGSGMVSLGKSGELTNYKRLTRSSKKRQLIVDYEDVPKEEEGLEEEESLISFERGPVCEGREEILYTWAPGAKSLDLPDKVGFKLGNRGNKFLVLQIHYHKHQPKVSGKGIFGQEEVDLMKQIPMRKNLMENDNSGLTLQIQNEGIEREAGILLMSSVGFVEPGLSKHEIWCRLNSNIKLHPFRFRVHTHEYGISVVGAKLIDKRTKMSAFDELIAGMSSSKGPQEMQYLFDNDDLNKDVRLEAKLIGEQSPQVAQMFYEVADTRMVIGRDDIIYAACYYNQTNPWNINIGPTSRDEMCNFYLMYWTEAHTNLDQRICSRINPRPSRQDSGITIKTSKFIS